MTIKFAAAMALGSLLVWGQAEPRLTIAGDIPLPLALSRADLAKMPRSSVKLDNEGQNTTYEGVLLSEVLKRAGAPLDKELSGKALATYVLAEARDGYQVLYSLAEIDPSFADHPILLADAIGGEPLSEKQGPFRLVVPYEKKGARSIRMLDKITVVRLRK